MNLNRVLRFNRLGRAANQRVVLAFLVVVSTIAVKAQSQQTSTLQRPATLADKARAGFRLHKKERCADESIPIVLAHLVSYRSSQNEELVTSQGLRIDQHSVRSATHTASQNIPGVEAVEGFVEIIIGGDRGALESCTDKCSLAP